MDFLDNQDFFARSKTDSFLLKQFSINWEPSIEVWTEELHFMFLQISEFQRQRNSILIGYFWCYLNIEITEHNAAADMFSTNCSVV